MNIIFILRIILIGNIISNYFNMNIYEYQYEYLNNIYY